METQKTQVMVLGATGMLGSAVVRQLIKDPKIEVTGTCRESSYDLLNQTLDDNHIVIFDPLEGRDWVDDLGTDPDDDMPGSYLINCIGSIKPNVSKNIANAIYLNSVFPYELVEVCNRIHSRMIHITTDCVFSGKTGQYTEESPHDEQDIYGRSKSLGEPTGDCMVLRTSIIGPEIHNNSSLIAWVQKQAANPNDGPTSINGYINHLWNGITTDTYGKVVQQIINNELWFPGLRHVHSPDTVNKFQLVSLIVKSFGLSSRLVVNKSYGSDYIDRTLVTNHPEFLSQFEIPTIEQQLAQYESQK